MVAEAQRLIVRCTIIDFGNLRTRCRPRATKGPEVAGPPPSLLIVCLPGQWRSGESVESGSVLDRFTGAFARIDGLSFNPSIVPERQNKYRPRTSKRVIVRTTMLETSSRTSRAVVKSLIFFAADRRSCPNIGRSSDTARLSTGIFQNPVARLAGDARESKRCPRFAVLFSSNSFPNKNPAGEGRNLRGGIWCDSSAESLLQLFVKSVIYEQFSEPMIETNDEFAPALDSASHRKTNSCHAGTETERRIAHP